MRRKRNYTSVPRAPATRLKRIRQCHGAPTKRCKRIRLCHGLPRSSEHVYVCATGSQGTVETRTYATRARGVWWKRIRLCNGLPRKMQAYTYVPRTLATLWKRTERLVLPRRRGSVYVCVTSYRDAVETYASLPRGLLARCKRLRLCRGLPWSGARVEACGVELPCNCERVYVCVADSRDAVP